MKNMQASDFKARCLAVLDEVQRTGHAVTILKRGKPVARLIPAATVERRPQERLAGSVTILGDIIAPALPATAWHAVAGKR